MNALSYIGKSIHPDRLLPFVLDQGRRLSNWQRGGMKRLGFRAMKAFLALSSVGKHGERVDWLRVVAFGSSIMTVIMIVLYFLQRGH
jgi:branched-subunit amino acid transport protein